MSEEFKLSKSPRHVEIRRYPSYVDNRDPMIRTYRSSPSDMVLQFRGDKQFATVHLTKDEAISLANAILERAKELN